MEPYESLLTRDEVATSPLSHFRCAGCGYGASCRVAPARCPMCSGSVWDYDDWRPFESFAGDVAASLRQEHVRH